MADAVMWLHLEGAPVSADPIETSPTAPAAGVPHWSRVHILTESWDFDKMHRRGGGAPALPDRRRFQHGDNHRYCQGNCLGRREGQASYGARKGPWVPLAQWRQERITAWRKAKAMSNRAYLYTKWGLE